MVKNSSEMELPNVHIPRESNYFGDLAAGVASEQLLRALHNEPQLQDGFDPCAPISLSLPLLVSNELTIALSPHLNQLVLPEVMSV